MRLDSLLNLIGFSGKAHEEPPVSGCVTNTRFLLALLLVVAMGWAASLSSAQAQSANGRYDTDGDRLIEVATWQQLHAVRFDLNGDGSVDDSSNSDHYAIGYPLGSNESVCDRSCNGYELSRSLDFNDIDSYGAAGWIPIRNFNAIFDGNGHTISNLYLDVNLHSNQDDAGLFGSIGNSAIIKDIGLLNVEVDGIDRVGGLVGQILSGGQSNREAVSRSYVTGAVTGRHNVGGLVGIIWSTSDTVTESYATVSVAGTGDNIGGLVGLSRGKISISYASGNVKGDEYVGGLAGRSNNRYSDASDRASISSSYATGNVKGDEYVGGLVGIAGACCSDYSTITNSYAIGSVSGDGAVGGLVGYGDGQGVTIIANSYYNADIADIADIGVGRGSPLPQVEGKTTAELQAPTARGGIYARWSFTKWDFGSSSQYPALKVDLNSDGTATAWEFGGQGRVAPVTPGSGPMVGLSLDDSPPRMIRIGSPVPVTATFTEAVSGLTVSDITVVNGTLGNFAAGAGGMVYTFDVTPSDIARVTVDIAADAAMDADGNGNVAALQLSFTPYDDDGVPGIGRAEAIAAIRDYFSGKLTRAHAIAVIQLYFASGS